ncbi:MarR family winged helix-turn-helix transcriptional regulator [Paractinoplanes lichenicola]|uniref:Winged helix-turn-helix transcriptional regulator n=1 Tax=Paractinoplanes lichenicola TaxID=2802976 RepID=A0ABS1VTT5_9ACTN|nr:MarR family winged helix-turn-helix transcriptional regulator [Actinoplanes lichenicola]MBL7257883.1 winged helix-turn-helix transcriptional regulator [Actinoplanes lichenicola]
MMTKLGVLLAGRGAVAGAEVRDALAGAGLTMRSAFTLTHLAGGPVNQQTLIDLLGVDPSALVTVLNELEAAGLVSRQRDPADRRRHIVVITAAGSRVLTVADQVLDKADENLFAALSPSEREQLQGLLAKVADSGSCGEKY